MPIATVNPATGELIKAFEPFTDEQIEQALRASATAFASYRHASFEDRAQWLNRLGALLEEEKLEFGRLMTLEMGKTYRSAIDEAAKCAWACRYYAEQGAELLADEPSSTTAYKSFIRYQSLGTILAVMPWNFPFWQAIRAAAPILMAGNVMLLKHASNVPQCALAIEDVIRRAGFPAGVFQTLLIDSSKVDMILGDPRVEGVTLTGSEKAGSEVAMGASRRIKKAVLELGGSDPFIVMPSANLDEAVAIAVTARCQNNGQSCIAAKRFIVAESIAAEFERKYVERIQSLKVGDPFEASTDVGPLSSAAAVKDLDEAVQKSIKKGARLLTGGKPLDGPGFFYAPTVLTDIPAGAPAYREELFGPVACLFRARDAKDAVRIANGTRFGLGASVWTNDAAEVDLFINEIEAGMVFVNRMVASDPRLPFGGIKRSGFGREMGAYGIREFTNVKTVWIEREIKESGAAQTVE